MKAHVVTTHQYTFTPDEIKNLILDHLDKWDKPRPQSIDAGGWVNPTGNFVLTWTEQSGGEGV